MESSSDDDAEAADAFWRVALMDGPAPRRCAADDAVPDLEDELTERAALRAPRSSSSSSSGSGSDGDEPRPLVVRIAAARDGGGEEEEEEEEEVALRLRPLAGDGVLSPARLARARPPPRAGRG